MSSSQLLPRAAAKLADDAYDVGSGDKAALATFLSNPLFTGGANSRQVLKAELGGRLIRTATDGFGLAAMGGGQFQGDLFLIFRGTTDRNKGADFLTDARIGVVNSRHIGFAHAFKSMRPDIEDFIKKNRVTGSVHCVGHSLGGAVATLAADWAYGNVSPNVNVYTFGQPRVGLTAFAAMFTQRLGVESIHRVFHSTDPVPMVPIFPYVHCPLPGSGHRINSEQKIITGEAHKMGGYIESVSGKHWKELERANPSYNYENAIEEWLQSKRNESISSVKTFEWLEQALFWLIKKTLVGLVAGVQWTVMGVHTFLDKIAWLLAKGIELKDQAGHWVRMFMEKIMRILGIPKARAGKNPTLEFFRFLLNTLAKRAYELAQSAIRGM
jgi:triacylglycerol lipase